MVHNTYHIAGPGIACIQVMYFFFFLGGGGGGGGEASILHGLPGHGNELSSSYSLLLWHRESTPGSPKPLLCCTHFELLTVQ